MHVDLELSPANVQSTLLFAVVIPIIQSAWTLQCLKEALQHIRERFYYALKILYSALMRLCTT